jgi:hypothetical protein
MRCLAGAFWIVCGIIIIAAAARFGFTTSDNTLNGYIWGFLFAAISFGCLFGHALAMHLWRHRKVASFLVFAGSAVALALGLSNTLGSIAGRGNEIQAKRIQIAETIRHLKRSLERAENERVILKFIPTDDAAVKVAKSKARAAAARASECKKRGDNCREREAAERKTLADLEAASKNKAASDRASALDADIAALNAKIENAGPILEAKPQGFARLFDVPVSKSSLLSAWQNLAMAITAEMLFAFSMIAFVVLGKGKPEMALKSPTSRLEMSADKEPEVFGGAPVPARFVDQDAPVGNVAAIMAEMIERGKGKVEFADAFRAYAQECHLQGKNPVSPPVFANALRWLCRNLNVKIETKGEHVYLKKVRLKTLDKAAAEDQQGAQL